MSEMHRALKIQLDEKFRSQKRLQRLMLIFLSVLPSISQAQPPVDQDWFCNAVLDDAKSYTLPEIGACQGVAIVHGKFYFYGDRYDVNPRRGEIHEYTLEMKPTGRRLILNRINKPLATHPTGIAYLDKNNVFIGNTVNQKAQILLLDWELAWRDGNLDRAVKNETVDDLAVNGCRPITISAFGKRWIATADYGSERNQVRLFDPQKLSVASKTSEPEVLIHQFSIGPYNQNLEWFPESGTLIGIQNVVAGLGWRLQFLDLNKAIKSGEKTIKSGVKEKAKAQAAEWVLPAHTELEGVRKLPDGRFVFVTAHASQNVWIGKPRVIQKTLSLRGRKVPFFKK